MKLIIKNNYKQIISIIFLVVVLSFILIVIYQDYNHKLAINQMPDDLKIKSPKERIVLYTEYPNSKNNQEPVIQYIYGTNQEAPTEVYQGYQEDISKRTSNAQLFLKESKRIDEENVKEVYVGKFYSGTSFYQDEKNNWYYTATATTTKTAFLKQTQPTLVDKVKEVFGQPAFAATDTIYSGAGDGIVYYNISGCSSANWTAVHNALTGGSVSYTNASNITGGGCGIGDNQFMNRLFFPFDTSSLPDEATISSASLNLDPSLSILASDSYGFVTVVQTTQASPTSLITADYDQCGAISNPTEGVDVGNRVFGTSITAEVYFSLVLNSTGMSWISKTSYTQLGVREGHDALNIEPVTLSDISIYNSEETGTAKDPYLSVTYSVVVYSPQVKINGGRLKINGGRVKIN